MVKIVLVDDMPKARKLLEFLLKEIEDTHVVASFASAIDALEFVKLHQVDMIFLDIEMPELNGIDAAKKIGQMKSPPAIVFLTSYSEYSIEAWKTDAMGYILKPFELEELRHVIEKYQKLYHMTTEDTSRSIEVTCFPIFNVFINGDPIYFKNKKAKEVMAYLIHNRGGWVSNLNLCYAVLEEMEEERAKNNLRTYLNRLKVILAEVGIQDLLEHEYGKTRINVEKIHCDYYEYLEGKNKKFTGEYLTEYSWAEPTVATLQNM